MYTSDDPIPMQRQTSFFLKIIKPKRQYTQASLTFTMFGLHPGYHQYLRGFIVIIFLSFFCHKKLQISYIINLSPSWDASPSLETLDGCLTRGRLAPGRTSSLLCTVNEDFPFEPKPNLRLRPLNPAQN